MLNDPTYDAALRARITSRENARQQAIEAERIAREEREREQEERVRVAQQNWRAALEADLQDQDASAEFISATSSKSTSLHLEWKTQGTEYYYTTIVVVFKNNLGTLRRRYDGYAEQYDWGAGIGGYCPLVNAHAISCDLQYALEGTDDPLNLIEEIYIEINGIKSYVTIGDRERTERLRPQSYPPLDGDTNLREPIRIDVTGI